jgi:hypothetical protein
VTTNKVVVRFILVAVSIAAGLWHATHQGQSVLISNGPSAPGCGGAVPYPCARYDWQPAPLGTVPDVGHLAGADTVVVDPSFGMRIARITDSGTEGSSGNNRAFDLGSSAEHNWMDSDDSRFSVSDAGGGIAVYVFNPVTMQATRMYASQFPSTNGIRMGSNSGFEWSFVQNHVGYAMENGPWNAGTPILKQFDFTSLTIPPSPVTLFDFSSSPDCSDGGTFEGNTRWTDGVNVSRDDQTFSTAISTSGIQDTATYVLIWNRTKGCRWYNTQTGEVGGQWGASGTVTIPDRYFIHNIRLSKDGNWARVARKSCISGCEGDAANYFWQIGTDNVIACVNEHCYGHWAMGYTHTVDSSTFPFQQSIVLRPDNNLAAQTELWTKGPPPHGPWDTHVSWENADPRDQNPILSISNTQQYSSFPKYAWDDEVDAYDPTGSGVVWRFAHTFNTGKSQFFSAANAIGVVSQDGRFFGWSSDWQGHLGNCGTNVACKPSGGSSNYCQIGVNCRSDVFIVELK